MLSRHLRQTLLKRLTECWIYSRETGRRGASMGDFNMRAQPRDAIRVCLRTPFVGPCDHKMIIGLIIDKLFLSACLNSISVVHNDENNEENNDVQIDHRAICIGHCRPLCPHIGVRAWRRRGRHTSWRLYWLL